MLENEGSQTLLNFHIQADKTIEHRRPNIVCKEKVVKRCLIIDIVIPGDQNIIMKKQEQIDKY